MITFLHPMALWGLTGLLVPIAIHLLSRKTGKVIPFGSLRHLQESNTAYFRSLRLNEVALLIIRCLLLSAMVLLLAGIQVDLSHSATNKSWLVVEKGIERQPEFRALRDSLLPKGYEIHYLAPGFPAAKDSALISPLTDYWQLAGALRSKPLHDIIVASYSYAAKFNGERPSLPDNLRWITFPSAPHEFPVGAIRTTKDTALVSRGYTTSERTSFHTSRIYSRQAQFKLSGTSLDSVPVQLPDSIKILLVYDNAFRHDLKIMMAALEAVQSITPHKLIINHQPFEKWNSKTVNDWTMFFTQDVHIPSATGNTIIFRPCTGENLPLFMPGSSAAIPCSDSGAADWVITQRLNEDVALREGLTGYLAALLLPKPSQHIMHDRRTLPEPMMWSVTQNNSPAIKEASMSNNLDHVLNMLILMLLIGERWLAYKRNQ